MFFNTENLFKFAYHLTKTKTKHYDKLHHRKHQKQLQ
jgi:hypothetical protein